MNLFDRLPSSLFNPLTGQNNRRAWDLLTQLSERFFGPDCVPDYPEGYLHERITKEIERFLLDRGWEVEGEEESSTPVNVQANQLLSRFVETGWFIEDRVGARVFVSMRPVVARFFELLESFTMEGPQLVGGNIQLIHNQLKHVVTDPKGQAAGFQSAALLCSRLINALNATTLRVRDLIRDLTQEEATPIFVKRFFAEHIEEIYVRDFRQMRTENHPLMLRFEIIELVDQAAQSEPSRSLLLDGYRELPGDRQTTAEDALARDIARFHRLLDVEKFLERMDRVIDSATQRALAYLGYRLKASERMESVLKNAVSSICRAADVGIPIESRLFSPSAVIADYRLRMPNIPPAKPVRRSMKKREMTPRERAELILRKAMIRHRDTTPVAIHRYVESRIPVGSQLDVSSLPIESVEDAVAVLVLMRMASILRANPRAIRENPLFRGLKFDVQMKEGIRVETLLFEMADFIVIRRS
jgi:hypothetical protein